MTRATLELHNQPQHLFLRNINVMQTSAIGPALKMHFDLRKDVRGQFMARQDTLLSLANVHAINENGQSSVDIDRINHQTVNVEAVNFRCRSGEGKYRYFYENSWEKLFILNVMVPTKT